MTNIESNSFELFPENITTRLDYIKQNSCPKTYIDDQIQLADIQAFYSFGDSNCYIDDTVGKGTLALEAIASVSLLALSISERDVLFGLLAIPVTGLFFRDLRNRKVDPNRHEHLTTNGMRRICIEDIRQQLADKAYKGLA